jgi:YbbR domain-containing protein
VRSLGLKLLALFLACIVWFVVSAPRRERATERAFAAPLSIASLPRDLVITNQIPDTVSVRLRGRVSDLRALSSQNLEVTVDVSWVQPGEATITLRPQAINVPPDVDVISIDPNKLRFHVETLRQKYVRVRPLLVGTTPSGYRIGDPSVVPDQALVSGPASQIKNLADVATERIIMTGRTDTFTQNAAVVSDSPFVRVIEPLSVQVTVPVLAEVGPPVPTTTATTNSEQ